MIFFYDVQSDSILTAQELRKERENNNPFLENKTNNNFKKEKPTDGIKHQ